MPRFFVKAENIENETIKIVGDDAFHIARSLRMAVGDEITVSNGEGEEFFSRLTKIRDEECECEVIERRTGSGEPPIHITLFMAYPKGDKLETVIQKAVELGVSRIVPFESSRCIKRPKAEKLDKQLARFSRIAEEAAKQCGRSRLPTVAAPMGFSDMLSAAKEAELALFCYEGEDGTSLKAAISGKSPVTVSVVVGSEGGFSPEEAEAAISAGLTSVSLGKRILRCETAPAFVLSAFSYETEL